jgi:hypothetical protein
VDTLITSTWLPQAELLEPGERKRVDHDCGSGRTLIIKRSDKGLDAYCWRCSAGGFKPAPEENWQVRIARMAQERAAEREVAASLTLPTPMNKDPRTWPLEARVWLYKAGFTNDEITRHGFYYVERLARVVLPVWGVGRTVSYWQARGFAPGRAKYINPQVDRSRLVAKYAPLFVEAQQLPLVLTEDILSAARVGSVTHAWSLLGTAAPAPVEASIIKEGRKVLIWLDPDAAGNNGATKLFQSLRSCGVDCRVIRTDKDPKLYSEQEIRRHLQLA